MQAWKSKTFKDIKAKEDSNAYGSIHNDIITEGLTSGRRKRQNEEVRRRKTGIKQVVKYNSKWIYLSLQLLRLVLCDNLNGPQDTQIFVIVVYLLSHVWPFVIPRTCQKLARLLCPWDFLGKNTGVGCHLFLQGDLPDPWIKPMSHFSCSDRWVLYHWATKDILPVKHYARCVCECDYGQD